MEFSVFVEKNIILRYRFVLKYSPLFLPAYVLNYSFNIFSVRLQTLSYIIILSIPLNAFNHHSKISISGLNYSRYHMQIH